MKYGAKKWTQTRFFLRIFLPPEEGELHLGMKPRRVATTLNTMQEMYTIICFSDALSEPINSPNTAAYTKTKVIHVKLKLPCDLMTTFCLVLRSGHQI